LFVALLTMGGAEDEMDDVVPMDISRIGLPSARHG
jgi:hypothetical protein